MPANPGGTRKERLMRAKMKKKIQEEASDPTASSAALTYDDILQMSDLSENSLLENLRRRYENDMIYTYVGPILIAINPYQGMPKLYSERRMTEYYGREIGSLPPHVFALADFAYRQLIQGGAVDPQNQSIIISGESGAGKTETTKIIMQYLARATSYKRPPTANGVEPDHEPINGDAPMSGTLGKLEERVLESNPLLESFGNAKTLRNDNSSRFGKFIEIQFNHHGKIVGAEIMNFLLEKTRIVSQSIGERNYHIFYQLLEGADDELKTRLRLQTVHDYEYLRHSECFTIPGCDDVEDFATTKKCMETIGLDAGKQENVFELLAAVLHLGNLRVEQENETAKLADEESEQSIMFVAELLQVSGDALRKALLTRQLHVGGKVIEQQQNVDQVVDKRDALAKGMYSSLFIWLVQELNRTISRPRDKWGFIGVLDIYGFEKFDWNTFEQLCINYANEKLQRHFNQHMLEVEQEEYEKEGIDWTHIDFQDNQPCLDLIESKSLGKPGIFITLDDIWRWKGDEANKKFVSILHANFGKDTSKGPANAKSQHPFYIQPNVDADLTFGIKHYAGEVLYDASGFNDKNNENLNDDMKDIVRDSKNPWIRDIFSLNVQSLQAIPGGGAKRPTDNASRRPSEKGMNRRASDVKGGNKGGRNLREVSVGAQFRFQLQELMGKISAANPRYVRCLKPNEFKRPGELNDDDCARQLKYSGMMEAIQIRQQGFALREDHDVFFYDYQGLAPSAEVIDDLVKVISSTLGAGKEQWQLGKTKVFLRREFAFKLQKLDQFRSKGAARRIQRWVRYLRMKNQVIVAQSVVRRYIARRKLKTLKAAARRIVSILRVKVAVSKFEALRFEHRYKSQHAIVIQRIARGYLVRKQQLLDPFGGLNAKDLDAKIKELEAAIAKAAEDKQFELCSKLQVDLEPVVNARKKVRTAKELDNEIVRLNKAVDEAAGSKQYAKCAELQKELEEVQEQRKHVKEDLTELTASELDERIAQMEGLVKEAMDARNFEKCGQLQHDLDQLVAIRKTKQSAEEMDDEIEAVNQQLANAMKEKNFGKCAQLQKELDDKKSKRWEQYPDTPVKEKLPEREGPVPTAPTTSPAALQGKDAPKPTPKKTPPQKATAQKTPAAQKSPVQKTPAAQKSPVAKPTAPVRPANGNRVKASVQAPAVSPPQVARGRKSVDSISGIGRPRSDSNGSAVSASSHARSTISMRSTVSKTQRKGEDASRTVSRLRPAKALTMGEDVTVAEAAREMKKKRTSAVLATNAQGALTGILTDTDTARRVISQGLDPDDTLLRDVMTGNPSCVSLEDSAIEALDLMLSGKFRHLPVVSHDNGNVVGVLNVAKCLHDAIRRLEKVTSSLQEELENSPLRSMLEKVLAPTLRDVLSKSDEPETPVVSPEDTVADVTLLMAKDKKPALVVSEMGELVGIFTPKDLLHRVIAAGLSVDDTLVEEVMTEHPESASPDTTVLDAFHIMHDGKFLNLPVVDQETGEIFGIADVLSLSSSASLEQGESGQLWSAALELPTQGKDVFDDTASMSSFTSRARQRKEKEKPSRAVSSLRPTAAVTVSSQGSVVDAAVLMKQKHTDAVLVVDDSSGLLVGILTDTDVCRRVLAKDLDPEATTVADVMTGDIQYVAPEDSAIDALLTMQDGHFRHLPVVERDSGTIAGVLNIGKCLYDVSKRLEHASESTEQMKASLESQGSAVQKVLGPMLQRMADPTIDSILQAQRKKGDAGAPTVTRNMTVSQVAKLMGESKQAALVIENEVTNRLIGVFSPYELAMKVIAQGMDPETTLLQEVMLTDPDVATPQTQVVEALQIMHETQCLNLPVVQDEGSSRVVGLVDVLALSYGTIDALYGQNREQMEEFWSAALTLEQPSQPGGKATHKRTLAKVADKEKSRTVEQLRPSKVLTIEEHATVDELSVMMGRSRSDCVLVVSDDGMLVGIVTDTDLARRAVAQNLPTDITTVGQVMTKDPAFVSTADPAIDALFRMLEGKFRHLPVVETPENGGGVVGILKIDRCLYDAIRKMEKMEASTSQMRQTLGKRGNLSTLLGPMVDRMFSPNVQTIVNGDTAAPRVQPYTSVLEVSRQMASTKKAALVVSNRGQFFGVFTPQDLVDKVLSKGLPVHTTPVCEVMTEPTQALVYAENTVLDALHVMHDQRSLYLPVLQSEQSPTAVGLVDVLSLSFGSFAKGDPSDWREFWNTSFEAAGDDDETSSHHSLQSSFSMSRVTGNKEPRKVQTVTGDARPVSKLRPSKAVTISESATVADAAAEMGKTHTDAALVISSDGMLKGILTDTDVTRRVVALGNDPNFVSVSACMTPNPKFVNEKDSAMDAMFTMLDGKFRHLPVVDTQGLVAGMLRIQKCLYDSITRLEKAQKTSSSSLRENLEKQLMSSGFGQGLGKGQGALDELVTPMIEKLLSPTLDTLVSREDMPPLVHPTVTVMEAARQMASTRKAALVVEDLELDGDLDRRWSNASSATGKRLTGVFTPKDLLLRVVGAGLDPAMTLVKDVMTSNPETVAPSTSLVDALHIMYEHTFLHLPVVEDGSSTIMGCVDVLSLCYGTFATGATEGGGDWRAFWDMSLALTKDDDERSSVSRSVAGSRRPAASKRGGRSRSHTASSAGSQKKEEVNRPVSKLRPRRVTQIDEYLTVSEAAKRMRKARADAVVITNEDGELHGILTDTDITRRVLARNLDPDVTDVSAIMTVHPSCVRSDEQAIEAVTKMLEGRFNHLPVTSPEGVIQGMLDITKCLYDAINGMEKVQQSTEAAASELSRDLGPNASSLNKLLGPMMDKMVRPTVGTALEGEKMPPIVDPQTSVSEAAMLMAETKKGAVVLDDGELVGIVTPKDLLRKLVAKGLTADETAVEEVMSVDPEYVCPDARILDALRLIHDSGQLFVPVLHEQSRQVIGMVDVLCLSYGQFASSSGSSGGDWRQFWQTAMHAQDEAQGMFDHDDTVSVGTIEEFERSEMQHEIGYARAPSQTGYSELGESVSVVSGAQSMATTAMAAQMRDDQFIFKVSDRATGSYHRLMSRFDSLDTLVKQVRAKVSATADDEVRLKYEDDDGDLALLTTDESLIEAVQMAKNAGWKRIVLLVDIVKSGEDDKQSKGKGKSKRNRKLTAVEEDADESSSSEDESSDEEDRKRRKKKGKKKGGNRSSWGEMWGRGSFGDKKSLLIAGSSVLVGIGSMAAMFMRKKN